MPNLPSVSVTQPQADRLLLAFGVDQPTAVLAYKDWLISSLRTYVIGVEQQKLEAASQTALYAALSTLNADLPPEPVFPA